MISERRTIRGIRLPDSTPPHVGFGRLKSPARAREKYPMRAALPRRAVTLPTRKRWRLFKRQQLDQGNTPECVTHTGKHWELSLPTYTTTGLTPHELYLKCKERDGFPDEEGTSGDALLQVYRELNKVASWHWYDGNQMDALTWLLTKGPLWFGAAWSESMFRTNANGLMTCTAPFLYGHETIILGADMPTRLAEICNSWGNDQFGIQGRGFLHFDDLFARVDTGGDLIGVVEA